MTLNNRDHEKVVHINHPPNGAFRAGAGHCRGAMFYLYKNGAATGRTAGQNPQWRHYLPGPFSIPDRGLYRLSVVQEQQQ